MATCWCLVVAGFLLCLGGVVMSIVSLVFPNWTKASYTNNLDVSWGLFKICASVHHKRQIVESCQWTDIGAYDSTLTAACALVIIGVICKVVGIFGAFISAIVYSRQTGPRCGRSCNMLICLRVSTTFIALAGLFSIIADIVFWCGYRLEYLTESASVLLPSTLGPGFEVADYDLIGLKLDWSFYVHVAAGCCTVLGAIFMAEVKEQLNIDDEDMKTCAECCNCVITCCEIVACIASLAGD